MARTVNQFSCVNNIFSIMVHTGLLQLVMVVMAIAERCTRAVPIQEYPAKKVHVLRRVPATCSNWDKAWSWLTKVDCGTKYRLDLVTVPSREVRQYKLQYVCCDGDTDCKDADNIKAPGFDATDEKFLAIVLGSTAACVVIVIIIFAITFYTKKSRCRMNCDQETHVYTSAEIDDTRDVNDEAKHQPEYQDGQKHYKGCEAEYAEICDPRLPRYTDIFKENTEIKEDPFNKASAPPLYSALPSNVYTNSEVTSTTPLQSENEIQKASPSVNEGRGDELDGSRQNNYISADQTNLTENGAEVKYYNVREKRRRKTQGSQGESANISKGEIKASRTNTISDTCIKSSNRKSRNRLPVSVEMMVKSASASENMGKVCETSLTKQNRRSAPPGSMDASSGYANSYTASVSPASSSSVIRSNSNSTCTVIHEGASTPAGGSDKINISRLSQENLQEKSIRKTSRASDSSPVRHELMISASYNAPASEIKHSAGSTSPSKGVMLECDHAVSRGPAAAEASQPNESDSLLRSSSCHSGCGGDSSFGDCEHCAKYDRIDYTSDSDAASLHIYQCLDEVKKEVQNLRDASSASICGSSKSTNAVEL